MKRKRIHTIHQIWNGENLLIKDFTDLDLSNIDLSQIPMGQWEGCIFLNTNFSNTGIRFNPSKLGFMRNEDSGYSYITLKGCDFSDNDLSYLCKEDFYYSDGKNDNDISVVGCNFRNTHINFFKHLFDMTLDESYANFDFDFWRWPQSYQKLDINMNTFLKNPFLKIPSERLMLLFKEYVNTLIWKRRKSGQELDDEFYDQLSKHCEQILELDKQGYAKKLYYEVTKDLSPKEKCDFFELETEHTLLKDINIEGIPINLLGLFIVWNSTFENVSVDNPLGELIKIPGYNFLDKYEPNTYKSLYLPGITTDLLKTHLLLVKNITFTELSR